MARNDKDMTEEDMEMRKLVLRCRNEIVYFLEREEKSMRECVEHGRYADAAQHKAEARGLRIALRRIADACSQSLATCHLQDLLDIK